MDVTFSFDWAAPIEAYLDLARAQARELDVPKEFHALIAREAILHRRRTGPEKLNASLVRSAQFTISFDVPTGVSTDPLVRQGWKAAIRRSFRESLLG